LDLISRNELLRYLDEETHHRRRRKKRIAGPPAPANTPQSS